MYFTELLMLSLLPSKQLHGFSYLWIIPNVPSQKTLKSSILYSDSNVSLVLVILVKVLGILYYLELILSLKSH